MLRVAYTDDRSLVDPEEFSLTSQLMHNYYGVKAVRAGDSHRFATKPWGRAMSPIPVTPRRHRRETPL